MYDPEAGETFQQRAQRKRLASHIINPNAADFERLIEQIYENWLDDILDNSVAALIDGSLPVSPAELIPNT